MIQNFSLEHDNYPPGHALSLL